MAPRAGDVVQGGGLRVSKGQYRNRSAGFRGGDSPTRRPEKRETDFKEPAVTHGGGHL